MSDVAHRRGADPVWIAAAAVGGSALLATVGSVAATRISIQLGAYINLVRPGFLYSIVAVSVTCALVCVALGKRPRSTRYVVLATVLGGLAGLAPVASLVYQRLSIRSCAGLNLLGLPWPEPWREMAHVGAGLVWLSSIVFLVAALFFRSIRVPALVMWGWTVLIAVPTFLLYFLMIYGDPGPGCVPF